MQTIRFGLAIRLAICFLILSIGITLGVYITAHYRVQSFYSVPELNLEVKPALTDMEG